MVLNARAAYYENVREIEAVWDAARSAGGNDSTRLSTLIRDAEAYETAMGIAQDSPCVSEPPTGGAITTDMIEKLHSTVVCQAFTRWRSGVAAARACWLLMGGDVAMTTAWMNRRIFGLERTPLEYAEEDDSGLQMVLDHIGRIEAGVFS